MVGVARQELVRGQVVALQGVGGFQLLADARNEAAVRRLRERKRRPAKPLAVLVRDLAGAATRPALRGRRADAGGSGRADRPGAARRDQTLAPSVHPGLDDIGILLPTTPLHALLTKELGPLVATSGNSDGDPLEYDADWSPWNDIADLLVFHDRPIARPVDDSVVRFMAGRMVTIRLARGFAPYPLELEEFATARRRDPGVRERRSSRWAGTRKRRSRCGMANNRSSDRTLATWIRKRRAHATSSSCVGRWNCMAAGRRDRP